MHGVSGNKPAKIKSVSSTVLVLTLVIVSAALVLTLGLGYQSTVARMEDEAKLTLELLMRSRSESESHLFINAENNITSLKTALLQKISELDQEAAKTQFHALFELDSDGLWRVKDEINDFTNLPTLYLHNVELNPSVYKRAVASYQLIKERGPAIVPPYYSIYMDFVEKGLMVFSPALDWGRNATIASNNFNYPTMIGSQPANNPEREKFWTPVYFDEEALTWMVSVIEPLDIDEQWVGTVGHDVALDNLMQPALSEYLSGTYNIVFSKDGQLIVHPEFTKRIQESKGELDLMNLDDPFLNNIQKLLETSAARFGVLEDDSGDFLYGFGTISGPDWKLITVYPTALISSRAFNALKFPMLVGLLILLVALALTHIAFRYLILEPLKLIDSAVVDFGLENKVIDIPITSENELGRLAKSFKSMSEILVIRENSLIAAHRYWERTFDTFPELICILDADMKIQRINKSFSRTYEKSAKSILGEDRLQLVSERNRLVFAEKIKLTLETMSLQTFINSFGNPRCDYEVVLAPLLDDDEQVIGIVEVSRDITENRKLETQLIQAQKMEAVGQLAGGIAHDFNNLLQVILGYSEILMIKQENSEDQKEAELILETASKAAALTSQLLTFSRQQELDTQPVDLNKIVSKTVSMVRRLIEEHIELVYLESYKPLIIDAGKIQIEQVILNLCVNARDAMPNGGKLTVITKLLKPGRVEQELLGIEGLNWCASVEIIDNGAGMTKETLSHIFEPFFSTKEKEKGTGLGLATAYGIVKQHKGTIQVSSLPALGSNFRVLFPLLETVPQEQVEEKKQEEQTGSGCILIAEDDAANRTLIENLLRSAGYTVICACDGEEAFDLYMQNRRKIDMLLFDVIMPRMNGRVAAEKIHMINPDIPCLFATGYSEDSLQDGFLLKEGVHLIKKPFRRRELLDRVHAILEGLR